MATQHADPNANLDSNNTNSNAKSSGNFTGAKKNSNITPFRVFARVRPFIQTELEGTTSEKLRSCVEMVDNKTILLNPNEDFAPKAEYGFDDSFWSMPSDYKLKKVFADTERKPFASQKAVYDTVASGLADLAMEGVNSCIMSYGQTGTGKTYTMMGAYETDKVDGGDGPEGIIPRVCHDVFTNLDLKNEELSKKKAKGEIPSSGEGEVSYKVDVIFVEVYMEKVRDLLDSTLRNRKDAENAGTGVMKEAKIRLDPEGGPYIEGVTKYEVDSWKAICPLLERGQAMRKTCATTVHQQSSRSHAIFQLTITQETKGKPKFVGGPPNILKKTGRINLVDLAGSERGGHQDYVKESAQINKSLLTLRRVIDGLVDKQNAFFERMRQEIQQQQGAAADKSLSNSTTLSNSGTTNNAAITAAINNAVVPYRESVLTWLLSDSIGGNACTTMIAALSPHQKNFQETYSTLLWSSKARGIVSVVKVNDVNKSVTQGMGSKLVEMEERLSMQKQNVDIIKQELTLKADMIAQMEADLARSRESTDKFQDGLDTFIATAAALTIQRSFLAKRQGKSISKLTNAIETVEDELNSSEADYKSLLENKTSLEKTQLEEEAKLVKAQKELDNLKSSYTQLQAKDKDSRAELDRLRKAQEEEEEKLMEKEAAKQAEGGIAFGSPTPKKETLTELRERLSDEVAKQESLNEETKKKIQDTNAETKDILEKKVPELEKKAYERKNDPELIRKRDEATKESESWEGKNKTFEDTTVEPKRTQKKDLEEKLKKLKEELAKKNKKK